MNILLVEDDFDVARSICEYFENLSYMVEWAPDGLIGLDHATRRHYDCLILDVSLPRLSGVELCARLRNLGYSRVPILMLTAHSEVDEKVAAFDAGADDYVVKPFALEELLRRLIALIRRAYGTELGNSLTVADLEFDTATCTIKRAGHTLSITATGRKLLEALMRNSHRVLSRDELEQLVWGDEPPRSDALKIHIHSLREAIDKPFPTALLHTIRGAGYRLTDEIGAPQKSA